MYKHPYALKSWEANFLILEHFGFGFKFNDDSGSSESTRSGLADKNIESLRFTLVFKKKLLFFFIYEVYLYRYAQIVTRHKGCRIKRTNIRIQDRTNRSFSVKLVVLNSYVLQTWFCCS